MRSFLDFSWEELRKKKYFKTKMTPSPFLRIYSFMYIRIERIISLSVLKYIIFITFLSLKSLPRG